MFHFTHFSLTGIMFFMKLFLDVFFMAYSSRYFVCWFYFCIFLMSLCFLCSWPCGCCAST